MKSAPPRGRTQQLWSSKERPITGVDKSSFDFSHMDAAVWSGVLRWIGELRGLSIVTAAFDPFTFSVAPKQIRESCCYAGNT
jgi:hypothetical protein